MAGLDILRAAAEARAHLREAFELSPQTSASVFLVNCLEHCGHLCAATRRWADAITVWAACDATSAAAGLRDLPYETRAADEEALRKGQKALGPAPARAAEERGAAMTPAAAAEYALHARSPNRQTAHRPPGLPQLSAREQELVTLVARGRTDTQIAAQLYISVRTVRSHLDRIRDKTGCRRRADLTRLALQAGLI